MARPSLSASSTIAFISEIADWYFWAHHQVDDGAHPLRIALDKLRTLDTVRIIEGDS